MKTAEIREMDVNAMQAKIIDLKEAYFNLRFQHGTGQLESPSALKKTKREIARIITIMKEAKKS